MVYRRGSIMPIIEGFRSCDFDCRCGACEITLIDSKLIHNLDRLQLFVNYFSGEALQITSAYRCEAHNRAVGGSKTSQHMAGKAIDIVNPFNKLKETDIREILFKLGFDYVEVNLDKNYIHMDTRYK